MDRYLDRIKGHFDQQDGKMDERMDMTRGTRQRSAGLEQEARQPRLATEADVKSDTKTRKCTEDAAAGRVINGDSFSVQVDPDPMYMASFGDGSTKPLALPYCRDDALVDKGAAAPKPCLSSVEMRTLTTAGGLLPAGTASIAMRTIFLRSFFFLKPWRHQENYQPDKESACPPL